MIFKDFRGSVREKFLLIWLLEVSNIILIEFYFAYINVFLTTKFFFIIVRIFISIVLLISSQGLLQIYFNSEYMIFIYMLE